MNDPIKVLTTPKSVAAGDVARALSEMWSRSDAENTEASGQAMVRACGLTVIALAANPDEMARLGAQVTEATVAVPARTLLVETDGEGSDALSAEVSAFCSLGPGGRHVCQEQVLLKAGGARLADLPALIAALPVADLPVVLYLGEPDRIGTEFVERLLPAANVLLTDSSRSKTPERLLPALLEIHNRPGITTRDLAFERLDPWRQEIAGAWDRVGGKSTRVTGAEVRCPIHDGATLLLVGWIESCLGGAGKPDIRLTHSSTETKTAGEVRAVEMEFQDGDRRVRTYLRQFGRHVAEMPEDPHCAVCPLPRPMPDDTAVLIRILSDPQDDRTYSGALAATAARIASS